MSNRSVYESIMAGLNEALEDARTDEKGSIDVFAGIRDYGDLRAQEAATEAGHRAYGGN